MTSPKESTVKTVSEVHTTTSHANVDEPNKPVEPLAPKTVVTDPPVTPPVVKVVEPSPKAKKEMAEYKELLAKVSEVLAEHGQRESDIPLGNEYWSWNARLRQLRAEGRDKVQ
jgi:hypothetical protein